MFVIKIVPNNEILSQMTTKIPSFVKFNILFLIVGCALKADYMGGIPWNIFGLCGMLNCP